MPNAHQVSTSPDYAFYTRQQYFAELVKRIHATSAGSRVLLTTMAFDAADPHVHKIIIALEKAARRGVYVRFAIDAYDFMVGDRFMGPLWWHTKLPRALTGLAKRNFEALTRIRAAGGECTITNMPGHAFSVPFAGRSHIKCAVINDFSFVGGCNLHNYNELDCMVGWEDKNSADWLFNTLEPLVSMQKNAAAFGTSDKHFKAFTDAAILLDVGVRRQSIIMKNAFELIDQAQEWIFLSCQFFPNSKTADKLRAAHKRGVKVYLLLNDVSKHGGVHSPIQRIVTPFEKTRSPQSFFDFVLPTSQPYLHAKVLASEQQAILGSHNYIISGVNFGTAELAIQWQNSQVARKVVHSLLDQTPFAHDKRFSFLDS